MVFACRDLNRTQAAIDRIKDERANVKCDVIELDLARLHSVRMFAANFKLKYKWGPPVFTFRNICVVQKNICSRIQRFPFPGPLRYWNSGCLLYQEAEVNLDKRVSEEKCFCVQSKCRTLRCVRFCFLFFILRLTPQYKDIHMSWHAVLHSSRWEAYVVWCLVLMEIVVCLVVCRKQILHVLRPDLCCSYNSVVESNGRGRLWGADSCWGGYQHLSKTSKHRHES